MPWVDRERCVGCGVCVERCPAGAISMREGKAEIEMEKCIRCGQCHDFCPQGAIMHDREKIPQEVEENMEETRKLLGNFKEAGERREFLKRMVKHFNKEKTVSERTIERIEQMLKEEKN